MKITTIGGGYVGLTTSLCFAASGSAVVTCLEANDSLARRLQSGICPLQEPKLDQLLLQCLAKGAIEFTTQAQEAVTDPDYIVIAVGTPETEDGSADLSQLKNASEMIGKYLRKSATIIIKSTIPPGGTRKVAGWIFSATLRPELKVDVVYSPEFLREGSAVDDFLNPTRIVIGCDNTHAAERVASLYKMCHTADTSIIITSPVNAELIKYASNSFLALKVAFVNDLARLCGTIGGDIRTVSRGIGSDPRIGLDFLAAGPGYGGSCLPKDVRAMTAFSREVGVPLSILEQADRSNLEHQRWIARSVSEAVPCQGTISVWGLTFKSNTADLRTSPSIALIKLLSEYGNYHFNIYDPTVHSQQLALLETISHTCFSRPEDTLENANILLLLVSWPEIKAFPHDQIAMLMRGKSVFDLCDAWDIAGPELDGVRFRKLGVGEMGS